MDGTTIDLTKAILETDDDVLAIRTLAELLGDPYQPDADANLIEDAEKDARLERLHYETLAALQVFLMHADLTKPA
ncbi:hypothetical protein [Burkholderia sp. NLJ2]|uniref:hypothetical protein n=1 Tax=Burkholderia sp. NLJ2 TaxID=3090699 RepID=UPI003C6C034F